MFLRWFCCAMLLAVGSCQVVAEAPRRSLVIAAVGDLMIVNYGRWVPGWEDPVYPFRAVEAVLREADVVFGNLEAPLCDGGEPTPFKSADAVRAGLDYVFKTPTRFASGLGWAGFTAVSLANNHMMDYRGEGLTSTLEALAHGGVGMVGAGRTEGEARSPFVTSRAGWRLGLLAYSDVNPPGYWATGGNPGISSSMDSFRDKMEREIESVRPQVDFLAVSIHWGEEYHHEPNTRQRELARFLVDHGADVVLGHHPHVLQRSELYHGKLILYSLGNFVSYSARGPGRLTAVALIPADDPGKTRFVPVTIVDGQPRLVTDREVSKTILEYLRPLGRR